MRKITYSIIFYCICIFTQAQTSQKLTTGRNAYRAADKIVKGQVEFIDPGSSGKGLIWDFSVVNPSMKNIH